MSLVMTAEKFLLAIIASRHQKQMPLTRTNIDYLIFNLVIWIYSDVEVFAAPIGSNVDSGGAPPTNGFANLYSRSHAFKHGF
jgi:hypothetical protein